MFGAAVGGSTWTGVRSGVGHAHMHRRRKGVEGWCGDSRVCSHVGSGKKRKEVDFAEDEES